MRLLLKSGSVQVDEPINNATTALHIASLKGQREAVEVLLEFGANASKRTSFGYTPFLIACRYARIEVAARLLLFVLYTF